jgi:hypothetical protein
MFSHGEQVYGRCEGRAEGNGIGGRGSKYRSNDKQQNSKRCSEAMHAHFHEQLVRSGCTGVALTAAMSME